VLSDAATPDAGNPFARPVSIAIDAARSRALVVDNSPIDGFAAVIAVDLTTGARTVLSDSATPNANNPFDSPVDVAVDDANGRALVLDASGLAVIAVDLATGVRSVLSSNTSISGGPTPGGGVPFDKPLGIELDPEDNRALVSDDGLDAIIAVDLTTGERTVLSGPNTPNATTPFVHPEDIVLDRDNRRALVADSDLDAVVAMDLTTGARALLSDSTTPDARNRLDGPVDVIVDTINNRILVLDEELSVIALHPDSGERVDFSR
jgi:hypothetical protein